MREVGLAAILRGVDETAEHLGLSQKYVKDCVKSVMQGDPFFDAVQRMVWDSIKTSGESATARTYKLSMDTVRRFQSFMESKEPKKARHREPNFEVTEWHLSESSYMMFTQLRAESALSKHLKRPETIDDPEPAYINSKDFVSKFSSMSNKSTTLVDAATKSIMIAEVQRSGNALEVADKYGVDAGQLRYWVSQYYKTGKLNDTQVTTMTGSGELSEAYNDLLREPQDIGD
mmetsp:Transcript_10207/g.19963  ORF Transcript_10207/g.19963 Transcript_10207/m.19963 type:complete len:231 (+) Transcript_10207:1258-1950(+)